VVSLSPSNTELLHAIGAQELMVGRTSYCDYPTSTQDIPSIGSLFPPDFERILSVRPNLVVMSNGNTKVRDRLRRLNIPVIVIHPKTVDDIADSMRRLGVAVGYETRAEHAAQAFEKRLMQLSKKGQGAISVLYEVASKPMRIPGQTTFLADLIRHAGGIPIGHADQGDWPMVNREWVLTRNPDVMLVTEQKRIKALNHPTHPLRNLSAVKAGTVYVVPDPDLFVRPGPRVLDAIRWLINTLKP